MGDLTRTEFDAFSEAMILMANITSVLSCSMGGYSGRSITTIGNIGLPRPILPIRQLRSGR